MCSITVIIHRTTVIPVKFSFDTRKTWITKRAIWCHIILKIRTYMLCYQRVAVDKCLAARDTIFQLCRRRIKVSHSHLYGDAGDTMHRHPRVEAYFLLDELHYKSPNGVAFFEMPICD